jgi:hypothetical protein
MADANSTPIPLCCKSCGSQERVLRRSMRPNYVTLENDPTVEVEEAFCTICNAITYKLTAYIVINQ